MNRSSLIFAIMVSLGLAAVASSASSGATPMANQGTVQIASDAPAVSQPDARGEIENLCRDCLARQEDAAKTLVAAQVAAKAGNAKGAEKLADAATAIIDKMQDDVTKMKAACGLTGHTAGLSGSV